MPANAILAYNNLFLRRGDRELFRGLSGVLRAGEVAWLRAPNGRGKTTLLRVLAGLLRPDRGQLSWRGEEFAARLDEPHQAISYLDDRLGLSRDLSVTQNLEFTIGLADGPSLDTLLQRFALARLRHRAVRSLSTGQKKRVGLARLQAERSTVWLLDEPANGLDTENRQLLAELISEHAHAGGCCLFASHDELPVERCNVQVMELGE